MRTRAAVAVALTALAVTGCSSGRDCSGLAASAAARDADRAAYLLLAQEEQAGGAATAAQVEAADDALHDVERAHNALEAACAD